ncbi:MAG TPA: hypothetical protein VM432_10055 [Bdellovibrionales bacterium]|nr:hypothetical protein [Bdellovibrionales bacterium]
MRILFIGLIATFVSEAAFAQDHDHHPTQSVTTEESSNRSSGLRECSEMEVWDYSHSMCMPLAMAGMPMQMAMLHYNSFFVQTFAEGPRGRNEFSIPNMFMADVGSSIGDHHYLNLELMGTFERWTFPEDGYPELLQIGEENARHKPYVDAQHPHSSPIMGLTLSDTITLGNRPDHAKLWFAPRGQSTDGPIPFMHRPTSMVNPDAPLGHHIGQDLGHIASTVLGSSIRFGETTIEASIFNGTEPEPTKVDLPVGNPNSSSARLTQEFSKHLYAMSSAAYVKSPEPHEPELDHIWRYSASVYYDRTLDSGWALHNAFIWGLVNFYDDISALNSFNEEISIVRKNQNIWSRIEYLQRTPGELQIPARNSEPRWVTAATFGYTHRTTSWDFGYLGVGASVTKNILPSEFHSTYSGDPLTVKIFLQANGSTMWNTTASD